MIRYFAICAILVMGLGTQDAAAELSLEGPCSNDFRWTATLVNQGGGGIATYNQCFPSEDLFYMRCRPGSDAVQVTLEYPFTGLAAQDRLDAAFVVGGESFPVSGRAIYSEMLGAGYPEFTVSRSDPLFTALQQGSEASLTLAGATFTMHLTGSSDMIGAMFEACP
ncbi:hypothetical protein [Gymnodinialimonas ulvae]|uniref:hypothetical protein n=1 Tax=Gymnodinialimonas ulvae TaxID=3126504 RepID=UPI0030A0DAB0